MGFSLPTKTYVQVLLDDGPYTLEIACGNGNNPRSKTVITVEKAGLVVYNIGGCNTYQYLMDNYEGVK